MQLNELKPAAGAHQRGKRVGRGAGSGLGKTCGRGHKGQKSRAGGSVKAGFEGGQMPLQRRLPKYGFRSATSRHCDEIRTSELNRLGADVVDLEVLQRSGLVRHDVSRVKIIASGDLDKAVTVRGVGVTRGARQRIEAAGGRVED